MCVEVHIDMRKYFQSTLMLRAILYHHITVHQGHPKNTIIALKYLINYYMRHISQLNWCDSILFVIQHLRFFEFCKDLAIGHAISNINTFAHF